MRAGFWQIVIVLILVLILFGHNKIPEMMKNLAGGINTFKKELKEEDATDKKTKNTPKSRSASVKKSSGKKPAVKKADASKRRGMSKKAAIKK